MAKLTPRQENLLSTAFAMLAAASQPSRQKGYVFDQYVADWFNRTLSGTRTPEPATHRELDELRALLDRCGSITVEDPA